MAFPAGQGDLAPEPKHDYKVLCRRGEGQWERGSLRLGLQVWLRGGLWGNGVPGPPGGRETSFEVTQQTGREKSQAPGDFTDTACGSLLWLQLNVPESNFLQTVREPGGVSRAGRMVRVSHSVTPSPSSHPNGDMKGSDRHACHAGATCPGPAAMRKACSQAYGLCHHCTTLAFIDQVHLPGTVVHSKCPPHSPIQQVALWSPRHGVWGSPQEVKVTEQH